MAKEGDGAANRAPDVVLAVAEERLSIDKREVDRGGVRVSTKVDQHDELVDVPLVREDVEVERVRVDRPVREAPLPRTEGDTLVIPIVEERLVVEKRLFVREEVRVRKRVDRVVHRERVPLRKQRAEVARTAPRDEPPSASPSDRGDVQPGKGRRRR